MRAGGRRNGPWSKGRYAYGCAAAVVAAALLSLTGCGSSSGDGGGDGPTNSPANGPATTAAAARDKGPTCEGTAPADGVHVLRGGGFRLPGGGGLQYAAASGDGRTRIATLRDGASYQDGQSSQKVTVGGRLKVADHSYAVAQICTYRVVLEPQDAGDRAALAAAPTATKSVGGAADDGLCFTTNPAVRAAAAAGFPPAGAPWPLLRNGSLKTLPTGLSVVLYSVDTAAHTAIIGASCAGVQVARFEDTAVGDTLELAGVTFRLTSLTDGSAVLTRTGA